MSNCKIFVRILSLTQRIIEFSIAFIYKFWEIFNWKLFLLNSLKLCQFVSFWAINMLLTSKLCRIWIRIECNACMLTKVDIHAKGRIKKNGLFHDIDQKGGWGLLQKSLLLEALEIGTCHWGGWVSKEDVTISKQTFRVVLYSLRRPSGSGSFSPSPQPV